MKPKIIVCLGKKVFDMLSDKKMNFSDANGGWFWSTKANAHLYVMQSPYMMIPKPELHETFRVDLTEIARKLDILKYGTINELPVNIEVIDNWRDLKTWQQRMGEGDDQIHGAEMLRRHRIGRFCEEARDQGGLLTQEDLAQILSCDARTIRRDIKALKALGIHIPTRGQQKDIGPTLTHKGVAIRHWLEGKEPQEVARAINHSLRAVERYLNHFARIIYCVSHGFSVLQTAFALGISNASVRAYLDIYEEFKDKEGFRLRVAELEAIGAAHHESGDAKKGALLAPEKWINSSQKGASKP